MANIYELTGQFLQLLDMLEDEEVDEQVIMEFRRRMTDLHLVKRHMRIELSG